MKEVLFFIAMFSLSACSKEQINDIQTPVKRSFSMAITDFPYAISAEAFNESFAPLAHVCNACGKVRKNFL